MNPLVSLLGCIVPAAVLSVAGPPTLSSPDGRLEVRFPAAAAPAAGGVLNYQLRYGGRAVLSGELGLSVAGHNVLADAHITAAHSRASDTTYSTLFGKNNPIRDQFHELTLDLEASGGSLSAIQVVLRVYNDGLAYRFLLPQQGGAETVEITDEPGILQFPGNPRTWPLYRENYTTSHEGLYTATRLEGLTSGKLMDLPLLLQQEDGLCLAITEANLRNYAGMYLKAEGDGPQRRLRCDLSPLPGQTAVKVRSKLPLRSPWRVVMVGSQPGRLIESNLILNLNDPPAISDTSWLRFGKTTWYWWNGPYQEPVDFQVGLNWETMKHYIDFCARNGITFHSIMSTPDEYPWYYQTQRGYGPGPDSDVSRPRAGFPMQQVVDYARSQGVGIRLWVHWKPLSERLEEAFAQYEKWGIDGLMVDFLDRDDQEMVLFAERVLQAAARHHLHVHFHGVWKPTGLQRTYPNLFNHEGVLNLEYLKWSDQCSPSHNLTVPFTRMLAGPMDYHLGGFRSVNREAFQPRSMKPTVLGTRCHHLAMYVVYENPMPMVADAPTAYEGEPGFDFIRQVPTTWDETRVINGEVGQYLVVARRKGEDWYVGAMTDWTAREVAVALSFLGRSAYRAELWSDALGSSDPNQLTFEKRILRVRDKLTLHLKSGGGQVLHLQPVR